MCRSIGSRTATDKMECYSCHTSWTTELWRLPSADRGQLENRAASSTRASEPATTRPIIRRSRATICSCSACIGETARAARSRPYRSSSALVLSSTNANREHIYVQQPPISACGLFSSQAFAPHYPHTERKIETKTCDDCHLSKANDNNAIMTQLLLLRDQLRQLRRLACLGRRRRWRRRSTGHRVGRTAGSDRQLSAQVRLSRLVRSSIRTRGDELQHAVEHDAGVANCVQLRGEYLYVAEGTTGMRVYDVASVGNKGFSEKTITAPFSPLGQDTHIAQQGCHLRGACRQPSRHAEPQHGRPDAQGQRGTADASDLSNTPSSPMQWKA